MGSNEIITLLNTVASLISALNDLSTGSGNVTGSLSSLSAQ